MIRFVFRPLVAWPPDRKQTVKRHRAPFGVTLDKAYRLLRQELEKLGVDGDVVIEAQFREQDIRQDGLPYASSPQPRFPGVILSARTKFGPLKWPCDACQYWGDNVRAIALTLQKLREIDRYGVTARGEQYTGWKALPAPLTTPPPMTVEEAAVFVANEGGGVPFRSVIDNLDHYRAAYRRAASRLHPDATGRANDPDWYRLGQAKAVLDAHHNRK